MVLFQHLLLGTLRILLFLQSLASAYCSPTILTTNIKIPNRTYNKYKLSTQVVNIFIYIHINTLC